MPIVLQPTYDLATDAASISQALRQLELGLEQEIADRIAGDLDGGGGGVPPVTLDFSAITGLPTTLVGYGITDAQPLDSDLTAIAALATTSYGRGLLIQANSADAQTYLGITPLGSVDFGAITGLPTTLIGYGITDAQPLDSDLTAIAALTTASFGRGLLTQATASDARVYLEVAGGVDPSNTPPVSGQFLTAYNSTTGAFTQAALPALNLIPAPAANLSLAGFKAIDLATPTTGTDATNKAYVDSVATGVSPHAPVQAATTADITLSAPQTIDGFAATAADRILVKDQTDDTENGIYTVNAGAWTRTTDADTGAELVKAQVLVSNGTVNGGSVWTQSTPATITIGATSIVWVQTNISTQYTAGVGLALTGTQFKLDTMPATTLKGNNTGSTAAPINLTIAQAKAMLALNLVENTAISTWAGSTNLTTLGTVTAGTWSGSTIAINKGGTAATTANAALNNLLPSQASNAGKVLQTDGSNTSWQLSGAAAGSLFVNVKASPFNATGNGVTDDTNAINSAMGSLSSGGVCFLPPGTYMINNSGLTIPASRLQIMGSGKGATILKAISAYSNPFGRVIGASSKDGWTIKDLTINMNNFQGSAITALLCNRYTIRDTEMLNFKDYGIVDNGGKHWRVLDNYFLKTTVTGAYQNQAILSSESAGPVENYYIRGNEIDGSGLLLDGFDSFIIENKIINAGYGSGIATGLTPFSFHVVVSGNTVKFSIGQDVNGFFVSGYELWAPRSVISGNIAYWCAGPGFFTGGANSVITGNIASENGRELATSGFVAGYFDSSYNASGSVYVGNRSFNAAAAAGPQQYGFDVNGQLNHVVQSGNSWNSNKLGSVNDQTGTFNNANDVGVTIKVAWTPGVVANAAQVQSFAINNGLFGLGDQFIVSSDVNMQGCMLWGYITSSGAAVAIIRNETGASKTFGAMNLYIRVIKRQSAPNY